MYILQFYYVHKLVYVNTIEAVYNDIGIYEPSYITIDIQWYQLIPHS
jgi:hypothetical protein